MSLGAVEGFLGLSGLEEREVCDGFEEGEDGKKRYFMYYSCLGNLHMLDR